MGSDGIRIGRQRRSSRAKGKGLSARSVRDDGVVRTTY